MTDRQEEGREEERESKRYISEFKKKIHGAGYEREQNQKIKKAMKE